MAEQKEDQMKTYTGELGTYESGRYATVQAKSPRDALKKLEELCKVGEDVVQIREGNKTGYFVYDYMNGFGIYEDRRRDGD